MKNYLNFTILMVLLFAFTGWTNKVSAQQKEAPIKVGAYYYDGWCGKNKNDGNPNEPWAKNAPRQLTRRMVEEFPEREPVWGWRSEEIMERQIDLAAENGIEFFMFCWYWKDSNGPINLKAIEDLPAHTSMNLYLKAKNKHRVKFGLLVANHVGSDIKGAENWAEAGAFWIKYFKDPQYITVDGKPLVVIFDPRGVDEEGLTNMHNIAKKEGLPGLAIAGCRNAPLKGFSHKTNYAIIPGYTAEPEAHKYAELIDAHKKEWKGTKEQPCIPQIMAGWDKRPWEGPNGLNQKQGWYYPDRSPQQFKVFLNEAISWMDKNPEQTTKERIVIIYAWNELGEGGYLVPTKGDPEAKYLQVIRQVVKGK